MKTIIVNTCFILFVVIICSGSCFSFPCDDQLIPSGNFKYMDRGNRCEGFYNAEVSSGDFDVVGLVVGSFKYELDPAETIRLTSPRVDKMRVHIRALSIPMRDYYRMDAVIHPTDQLSWPVKDVLAPAKLPYTKIGVFGWVMIDDLKYYLPVKAGSGRIKPAVPDKKIRIYIRPWKTVEKLRWRLAENDHGQCGSFSKPAIPDNDQKCYMKGQAVQITLPDCGPSKKVCLTVFALEKDSSTWLMDTFHLILED